MTNTVGAALVATLALGACAKKPDQIAAVEIEDHDYARLSCSQPADRKTRIEQDLSNLSAAQKAAASGDAWGVPADQIASCPWPLGFAV